MSETVEAPAVEETVTEAETSAETPAETPEVAVAPETEDALPQWAREKLTKANNEAAKYRVQAKEAAEQVKAAEGLTAQIAELSDAKAALAAELESARVGNLKLQAALSVGIPGESATEFAELLKGETPEEIQTHAEKVKELFGVKKSDRAVDPTQGLGGKTPVDVAPGMARLAHAYKS